MQFLKIILCSLLVANIAQGNEFLKSSKLLNEEGIKAFTGEFHIDQKELVLSNEIALEIKDLFQAGPKGILRITGVKGKGTIKGCGGDEVGTSYPINPVASPVIFQKIPKALKLHWIKSSTQGIGSYSNCSIGRGQKTLENLINIYKVGNRSFYIRKFKLKRTKVQADKACLTVDAKGIENKRDPVCIQTALKDPQGYLEIGSLNHVKDRCEKKEFYSVELDYDGKNDAKGSVLNFIGILQIKNSQKLEEWLILNSPGYEGEGILAVLYSEFIKGSFSNQDWVVYNGC